ncbi:hypothetical protein TOL5_16700 [Acinetobacter sp. Tol 5]|nr:hypothetical protein TOL5_16700 [Acinetobacter sp. Tol 5]
MDDHDNVELLYEKDIKNKFIFDVFLCAGHDTNAVACRILKGFRNNIDSEILSR